MRMEHDGEKGEGLYMIHITELGQFWLDSEYRTQGIADLCIRLQGDRCSIGCKACRACKNQMKLLCGDGAPGDRIVSAGGYRFHIDPALMDRAVMITVDAAGGIPVIRPSNAVL